jgi:putative flavoprotein involved in K+ transport
MIDCAVVGAGPAGLAASAALTDRQVEHVVLERGRAGESWRSQRWDSFRLNTVGWMNRLLGDQPADAYATGLEVVRRLERLAAACPVRDGAEVTRVEPVSEGYALRTGAGDVVARTVVVATGDQNQPKVPALARRFPARVVHHHTASYRRPGQLPGGAVLVVGSAQSGCQIAEDLLAGGRRVVLATSPVGRVPFRHRGRDTVEWLAETGFMDQRPGDLPDPSVMRAAMPILAPGRGLSLPALARAGVTLAGRLVAVDGERVAFDDSVAANIAAGDAFAARARAMVDEVIRRRGLDAPPAEPDEHDARVDLDPPSSLDLGARPLVPGPALAEAALLGPPARLPRRRGRRGRRRPGPPGRLSPPTGTRRGCRSDRGSPPGRPGRGGRRGPGRGPGPGRPGRR